MGVSRKSVVVTIDSSRGGTAITGPVSGEVIAVRSPSTGWTAGGSADITVTRKEDGGTILAVTNQAAGDFEYAPRAAVNTITGGTTAYGAGLGTYADGLPVDGEIQVVALQAAANTSGTVHIYYRT